jgi:hypothetical protein
VEQFAGLVRARRCWRDRGSLPRLGYQRRRAAACDERARCGIATPNLIDGQGAGGNSTRGPPAQRGPERHPMSRGTEALRRAAAA